MSLGEDGNFRHPCKQSSRDSGALKQSSIGFGDRDDVLLNRFGRPDTQEAKYSRWLW